MQVKEYVEYDATALASLVRQGEVSADEVYAAALAAIGAVNAEINAVADGPWDAPLSYASAGPFGAVPFVLKDLGSHPQGVAIRAGSRLTGAGRVFSFESALFRRFRDAGLATAALSTTPEFGFNTNTAALAYGPTRNPWDLARSAGGSSGGSAALVAAGAVPVAHGGDGGGSIRIPAGCNGIVGLKPSRGRTSDGPDCQEMLFGLAAEFVFTRTMRDCAAMLDAVAGAAPGDKFIIKEPARPWSEEIGAEQTRLRIAVHTDSWSSFPVDREVAAATDAIARQLEDMGHYVEQATPSFDWDEFITTNATIWSASLCDSIDATIEATGNDPGLASLERTTLASWEFGHDLAAIDLARAMRSVNSVVRTVGEFFTEWDLLITPTVTAPPLPIDYLDANDPSLDAEGWTRRLFDVCSFTPLFNWTGTPAVSLPLGWTSNGLPVGVQLAAPMCEEATLMRIGAQLEEAMPWRTRRPPVHAAALTS